jgi:hypothetical protein
VDDQGSEYHMVSEQPIVLYKDQQQDAKTAVSAPADGPQGGLEEII